MYLHPQELHLAPVCGADHGGTRGADQQITAERATGARGAKEYFRVGRYYRQLPPPPVGLRRADQDADDPYRS